MAARGGISTGEKLVAGMYEVKVSNPDRKVK
jgi:hypothetical protein